MFPTPSTGSFETFFHDHSRGSNGSQGEGAAGASHSDAAPQLPHTYDIGDVPPVDLTSDFDGEDDKQESVTSACAKDPAASFTETCVDEELTADERIKATQTHFFVSGGIGPTATPVCAGKIPPEDGEEVQAMGKKL